MNTRVNINGTIVDKNNAVISIFDHGFLFGDSVYEVVLVKNETIFALSEHFNRLSKSAQALSLSIPWDEIGLKKEIELTIAPIKAKKLLVRIVVTRGQGEVNIDPSSCKSPNWIILAQEFFDYPIEFYTKGVAITIVSVLRNSKESLNPAIKTGNYLNSVLAIIEAKKKDAYDGLMVNKDNFLCECTTSNFFLIKNGILKTPSIQCGILVGVTRKLVIDIARKQNISCIETELYPEDLFSADEAFVTSTTKGVLPVTRCDNRLIGNGTVGVITKKLNSLYREKFNLPVDKDKT